ncbi:reverse transcriptase domain-containing protein [Tanacetum coccineum]
MEEGKFLGYIVTSEGIRANPEKTKVVVNMPSPSNLKQMQWLSGKLAALNRFLSKTTERALPCLDTLKKCTIKKDFHWPTEAEESFHAMKKLIAELPTLTALKKEEALMVYLSAANKAVSAILLVERDGRRTPIHYTVKKVLPRPYNQGYHRQANNPNIEQPGGNGKIGQVGVELEAYDIKYAPRSAIKGQVLANFLADTMTEDSPTQVKTDGLDDTLAEGESTKEQEDTETKAPENRWAKIDMWKLYTDGASNEHRPRADLILIDPERAEYSYALRLNFANSNNDVEYEALLAGLRIATKMKADALSKLATVQCEGLTKGVPVEELNERSVDTAEVNAIIKEATRTWITPIQEYIEKGILPEDVTEARTIREKARNYTIEEGILY